MINKQNERWIGFVTFVSATRVHRRRSFRSQLTFESQLKIIGDVMQFGRDYIGGGSKTTFNDFLFTLPLCDQSDISRYKNATYLVTDPSACTIFEEQRRLVMIF